MAYITNPGHIAVFGGSGSKELELNRAKFQMMLNSNISINLTGAFVENRLVGVMNMAHFPDCVHNTKKDRSISQDLIKKLDDYGARHSELYGKWAEVHPTESHYHLGPIGVLPEMQGQGIGRQLMVKYCEIVDGSKEAGYLETDRPENVHFYKESGFKVIREEVILDVPCWFMWRDAIS